MRSCNFRCIGPVDTADGCDKYGTNDDLNQDGIFTRLSPIASMNRRGFLGLCGLGVGTIGGYTVWRRSNSPSIPDGMRVETKHVEMDVLTEHSSRESEFLKSQEEYSTVISGSRAANRELSDDSSIAPFRATTDFDESYLLVVQNGMQSEMELVLEAVSRQDTGLHLDISIDSPQGGPDDLLTHSLLVRITDEDDGVPAQVSVDIDGYV